MPAPLAAPNLHSARIIRDLARERGGRPDASLWFERGKLPVADAAQVNAVMSDAAASDDSDLRNIVHAGTPLTATSLALAERDGAQWRGGADGNRARLRGGRADQRGDHPRLSQSRLSWLPRGDLRRRGRGRRGCCELDAPQMAQAIALSATSIGGLATAADTSVAREYHAGLAAMLGVNAALAAQRGYLAEESILETRRGFFEAFGGVDGAAAGAVATPTSGESWDIITDMAIKLVPGGHPYHAFAEAAANAAREAARSLPRDVESITSSRPGMTALSGPLHPTDLIGMAHSPAYFAAAGVADGEFSWEHASAVKIADPVIHGLIDRVQVGAPPAEDVARYRQGATVTIRTHDGRTVTHTVYVPKGAAALGIAWSDVDDKYRSAGAFGGSVHGYDRGEPGTHPRFPSGLERVGTHQAAACGCCLTVSALTQWAQRHGRRLSRIARLVQFWLR